MHPGDIVVHRAPYGRFWRDKIEMISVVHSIEFSCVMMQVLYLNDLANRLMWMNYGLQIN